METIEVISLTLGVAWASGINLYAAVLALGYFGATGQVTLPEELQLLTDPTVLIAAGFMFFVEFFADKIPGVDTGWDALHTFIRIPAGAVLAGGMANGIEVNVATEFAAYLIGGGLAATSHATKAGTRALINTSPEPVTNWTASITEDIAVIGGLWAALNYPWVFIIALVVFILLVAWLLPKIWRALKRIVRAIGNFFSGKKEEPGSQSGSQNRTRKDILQELYHDKPKS
ncbi:MAG: DUF4126 domain-containing protein [Gammaproteobacteria bacterium]|nr:DUF4126 domain-containing protein [Gammaproteobacteria bacterium]NNJ90492.1 DUF4126 domain-containing protein [Gammaproteobacteria bacterium]